MIKNLGNAVNAIKELKPQMDQVVSHIFEHNNLNEGPLNHAVITIKDLFATKDAITQASSKILENFKPNYNAEVINKIKEAGGNIVAKVHSDELGLGGTGQYNAYGKVEHPLDSERIVGGSSSGSAATFTKSISIALGTDTGDSVRLPASYNGIVGFKPSYGAISRYGLFPYASSLDTVGYFAHNVNDIIEFSKIVFGQDQKDMTSKKVDLPVAKSIKPQKVAFLEDDGVLSPTIKRQYDQLKKLMVEDGIEVEDVTIDKKILNVIDIVYSIISFAEASSNDANLTGIGFGARVDGSNWDEIMSNTRTEKFGKMVQRRFCLGSWFLSNENQNEIFLRAQKVRRLIVKAFQDITSSYDVLVFPSTSIAPLKSEGKISNWHSSYLINNNLSGTPSISIPYFKENNMPAGLSITSSLYEDKKLLSHTLYIEKLIEGEKNE